MVGDDVARRPRAGVGGGASSVGARSAGWCSVGFAAARAMARKANGRGRMVGVDTTTWEVEVYERGDAWRLECFRGVARSL
jgi:hypothetical protein